jgi:hypothetical protein
MRNLENLDADSCPSVKALFSAAAALPRDGTQPPLKALNLAYTECGDADLPALVDRFPLLEQLILTNYAGTERTANAFYRLTLCRRIAITLCTLDEDVVRAVIGGMPCLQAADFSWTEITFTPAVFGYGVNARTGELAPQRGAVRPQARGRTGRGRAAGGRRGVGSDAGDAAVQAGAAVPQSGIVDGVDYGGPIVSRSLRQLRLVNCSYVMEHSIAVIVLICPALRVLDVSGCRYLGADAALRLFEGEGRLRAWKLPRLKELHTRPQGAHLGAEQRAFATRVRRLAPPQSPVAIYDHSLH